MFKCNLCYPAREFFTDVAYNIHNQSHNESEQEIIKELEQQKNNKIVEETLNNIEELGKMEVKMDFFKKKEEEQLVNVQQPIIRNYLYELHLEVTETKDKKFLKVLEEINKKLIELMNDNYDIVVKHQKSEKQF